MPPSLFLATLAAAGPLDADAPIPCGSCDGWNQPREPFRVFGNTWYVGVEGLSAVLITGDDGLVLIDGDLPQSAPRIAQNLQTAGFDLHDVGLILVSHTHFDHVGGVAALARDAGAEVVSSALGAAALRSGRPNADDPQYAYGRAMRFAAVADVRVVGDGETVRLGELAITARSTPGHTPGGTTWTWRTCEGDRCLDVVYADSLNPVSAPKYRFTDHPQVVAALRQSIATMATLPCDILLSVHPEISDTFARAAEGRLVDPDACRAYAATAEGKLERRLAEEGAPK